MENQQTPSSGRKQEHPILKVEISQYKSLHRILSSPWSVFKVIVTLLIFIVTLFTGLALVTIALKQMYPYNNIKINAWGATSMQDEHKEVIYWLFNTADLWANSGIHVEENDVLTIRASGKSYTAMHHLIKAADVNAVPIDKWVGTSGDIRDSARDVERGHYRIFKDKPQDALVMQVIPENVNMWDTTENKYYLRKDYLDVKKGNKDENFYFIGKERVNLRIHHSGVLHFAVNDIVLTRAVIAGMKSDPVKMELMKLGNAIDGTHELDYYNKHNYYNAWFDDNIGSFLIVIERQKK